MTPRPEWLDEGMVLAGPDGEPTLYRRSPWGVWAAWRAHRARPGDVAVRAVHIRHQRIIPSVHQREPWLRMEDGW